MPFEEQALAIIKTSIAGPDSPNVGREVVLIRKSDIPHPTEGVQWTVKRVDGGSFEIQVHGHAIKQPHANVPETWLELK